MPFIHNALGAVQQVVNAVENPNDPTVGAMKDYQTVKTSHDPTDISFALNQAIEGLEKFSNGSATKPLTKDKIADLNKSTRALEARADRLSAETRLAGINMRQRLRYLQTSMRHSQNMMQFTTQVEELKANHGVEIQKFGMNIGMVRDGHVAYKNELQTTVDEFASILA
ncbi:MAG: hypothetical protein ACRDBG_06165 [Waterburya sp.]